MKAFNAWLESRSMDVDEKADYRQLVEDTTVEAQQEKLLPPDLDKRVEAMIHGMTNRERELLAKRFAK